MADVAVIEANDAKAARDEAVDERLRPGDELHPKAHDEQNDMRVTRSRLGVFDGDSVGLD